MKRQSSVVKTRKFKSLGYAIPKRLVRLAQQAHARAVVEWYNRQSQSLSD